MNNKLDKPQNVRSEDAIDKHKLSVYLAKHLDSFNIADNLDIKQYPGGASNLTYLLGWNNQQVILRTAPRGANIKSAHDMGREFKVLTQLAPHFKYAPRAINMCKDKSIIGRDFYLMQKIDGIIPRKKFPMKVSTQDAQQLCQNLINVQASLHDIDINNTGLEDLGKGSGYIKRQILGWNQRYKNAIIYDSLPASNLMKWLEEHMPNDDKFSLIHNDYKFDNVILDANNPTKIIAVLDWEMATIGSPLMDLGCSLAYWIQKDDSPAMQAIRMMPTTIDGMMTRQQIIENYGEKTQTNIENFDFFYVFGLFRLAVIVQQIYKRYAEGKTHNPAFNKFGEIAKVLIIQAEKFI